MSEMRAVDSLVFHIGDKRYTFVPRLASPGNMPALLLLFTALLAQNRLGPFDVEQFMADHRLWNCFQEAAE